MDFEGLELEIFPEVYAPAEDSFLLAKYAKKLAEELRNRKRGTGNGPRILDMGCGCGIQSLVCANADRENRVLGADSNPRAVENSRLNAEKNRIRNAEFVLSDLFSGISGKFDGIVFNPPYLPTSKGEMIRGELNLAFDGGKDGRETTDRFLLVFPGYLRKGGALLMIESSLAGIERTAEKLQNSGFWAEIVCEERFFFERIAVIKAAKS